eukprot:scaffold25838_cov106-Skeletonema_dohrnii-CCMP3373.AAC.3
MVLESRAGGRLGCLITSPTTLYRRRYDHTMLEPCKRCFYTIMANYNGSLEAVDCYILTASATCCSIAVTTQKSISSDKCTSLLLQAYIMGHQKLSIAILTALDAMYDMPSLNGPHQVTYDAVATLLRRKRA